MAFLTQLRALTVVPSSVNLCDDLLVLTMTYSSFDHFYSHGYDNHSFDHPWQPYSSSPLDTSFHESSFELTDSLEAPMYSDHSAHLTWPDPSHDYHDDAIHPAQFSLSTPDLKPAGVFESEHLAFESSYMTQPELDTQGFHDHTQQASLLYDDDLPLESTQLYHQPSGFSDVHNASEFCPISSPDAGPDLNVSEFSNSHMDIAFNLPEAGLPVDATATSDFCPISSPDAGPDLNATEFTPAQINILLNLPEVGLPVDATATSDFCPISSPDVGPDLNATEFTPAQINIPLNLPEVGLPADATATSDFCPISSPDAEPDLNATDFTPAQINIPLNLPVAGLPADAAATSEFCPISSSDAEPDLHATDFCSIADLNQNRQLYLTQQHVSDSKTSHQPVDPPHKISRYLSDPKPVYTDASGRLQYYHGSGKKGYAPRIQSASALQMPTIKKTLKGLIPKPHSLFDHQHSQQPYYHNKSLTLGKADISSHLASRHPSISFQAFALDVNVTNQHLHANLYFDKADASLELKNGIKASLGYGLFGTHVSKHHEFYFCGKAIDASLHAEAGFGFSAKLNLGGLDLLKNKKPVAFDLGMVASNGLIYGGLSTHASHIVAHDDLAQHFCNPELQTSIISKTACHIITGNSWFCHPTKAAHDAFNYLIDQQHSTVPPTDHPQDQSPSPPHEQANQIHQSTRLPKGQSLFDHSSQPDISPLVSKPH